MKAMRRRIALQSTSCEIQSDAFPVSRKLSECARVLASLFARRKATGPRFSFETKPARILARTLRSAPDFVDNIFGDTPPQDKISSPPKFRSRLAS